VDCIDGITLDICVTGRLECSKLGDSVGLSDGIALDFSDVGEPEILEGSKVGKSVGVIVNSDKYPFS
jgi:hypothetical protein